ncbi:twin-arginine translocase TatA/TatE family subunit [Chloroflexota bacterium]
MFGRLGPLEIGLVVLIILIVFGAGKLPQVGGALGKGIRAFRKGERGEEDDDEEEKEEEPVKSEKQPSRKTKKSRAKKK